MTESGEQWFDANIAPTLLQLCKTCDDHGMSFVAQVEYAPGQFSLTAQLADENALAMRFLLACARAGVNIDGYFMAVSRICRQLGVKTDASIVMQRLKAPAERSPEGPDLEPGAPERDNKEQIWRAK